uniref:RBBP8 N-terminal like n=1 Tax=Catagonus wagneri TaxID=51154 RepID=A0A8C3VN00_9CETA
ELNSERCRDAQRVEELCAKNHQLREQQKALKENLRALENRLRAGLCDRCMVTQEMARKKQQEFESSLLQNLQHVFLLSNELTRLQEENDTLKEEVKRLRGPGPRPPPREGSSDPPSPRLLPSLGAQKAITEKPPGGREETEDRHPGAGPGRGYRPSGYRTSPVAKISPGASLPEARAPDMSPQRISNQLHGTIAVVRPGSRACSADRGSANGTPPLPPPRSSPPSPPCGHSLPLDSFLQASQPLAKTCESLKHSLPAERLCLLNRHLALHLRSPHCSPRAPAAAPSGRQPQGLKAGEAEAWEEPMGLLGLPGTLAGMRDPRLEGALHLLLAQQLRARGRARGARMRGQPVPGEPPPSPPAGSDSEGPEGEAAWAALPRRRHPQPAAPGSPSRKEATATQDDGPDKPLDLSERGRGRDGTPKPASLSGSLSPLTAHTPSPELPQGAETSGQPGAQPLSNGTEGAREPELDEAPTSAVRAPALSLASIQSAFCRLHPASSHCPSPTWVPAPPGVGLPGARGRVLTVTTPPTPQVGLNLEAGSTRSAAPGEGPRCFCAQERGRGLPQKRKRASDSWSEGRAGGGGQPQHSAPTPFPGYLESRGQPSGLSQRGPVGRGAASGPGEPGLPSVRPSLSFPLEKGAVAGRA